MTEALAEPRLLGRYTLLGRLAGGGMGTVHLARARGERGFSRVVAVKLLHPHLAEDADIVTRFLEEARVAALVKHPHVVSVLDVGDDGGTPFLVLDYVHGESFEGLLRAARRAGELVPLDVIAAVVSDMLEGLVAAHDAKDAAGAPLLIVHRDVSPHNVLVSEHGIAYVTDFGIAKVRDRLRLTGTNDMLGKAGYMAPEQLGGPGGITARTDLYGAGVVVWEALAGRKLFDGLEEQLLGMVEKAEPPAPSRYRPDVPPALDALVNGMLARDPLSRPESAAACLAALTEAIPRAPAARVAQWMHTYAAERLARLDALLRAPAAEPEPVIASTPDPTLTTAAPPRRRWRAFAALGLTLLAVGGAAGLRHARGRPPPVADAPAPAPIEAPTATTTATEPAAPLPVEAPLASAAKAARPRAQARTGGNAASCNPPFVVVDNIKHYKRECFADPGK